jgi:hypothetical protein
VRLILLVQQSFWTGEKLNVHDTAIVRQVLSLTTSMMRSKIESRI